MTSPGSTPGAARVLVVEDDKALSDMLGEILQTAGYECDFARDGQAGLHLGLTQSYDVVVLDRGLPAIEGLGVLARLRSRGVTTPVLILSALGLPRDRVDGLDAGAEDYLTKPFDVDELLARIRALRRRHLDQSMDLAVPGGRLLLDTRSVSRAGSEPQFLSDRECELLQVLARRPHQVFSRADLLDYVFSDATDEGVVDTYVHYLRRKLGRHTIRTVRGLGYQLGSL